MNRSLLLLLLIVLPTLAQATSVYRWVDAQGQVHYGQAPPPAAGAEPHSVRVAPASPAAAPAARPTTAPAAPATAAKPAADPAVERAERAKRCTAARERIQYLEDQTPRRLGVEQPDGTLARMTEEEFQERLDKARSEAGKNCGG